MRNFRSKEWFNNMSQERKNEICKKLEITEENLKKCGFTNENGEVEIDLLKVSYKNPIEWKTCFNIIYPTLNTYKEKLENDPVSFITDIYCKYADVQKVKKYKDNLSNDTRLKYSIKYILDNYKELELNKDNIEYVEYFSYNICGHCELFLFDAGMI